MDWRSVSCLLGAGLLTGCNVLSAPPPVTSTQTDAEKGTIVSSPSAGGTSAPNGWAGRSAGNGRVLKCGGEDPQGFFFASMVGAGRNARVVNGVITFTGFYGFPLNEEVSFPVRRPANYMDDPRCTGPDGTRGIWMSIAPEQNLWFFILPGERRDVQVNQLLPK